MALATTTYGRLLAFKLALFAAMLALAAANRFWITPALAQQTDDAPRWVARLRRHVFAEQALGLAVLMLVGVLGAQAPSVTLPA